MSETTDRRKEIINILKNSSDLVSGTKLANKLGVSRQVIVQDVAILKAEGHTIFSTNRGYRLENKDKYKKIIKVSHKDEDIERELNAIVDLGGEIRDVFINHKVYGAIKVDMNIKSRRDVKKFLSEIKSGISQPLKNLTENYHYHTIVADEKEILDEVEKELDKLGFLEKSSKYNTNN